MRFQSAWNLIWKYDYSAQGTTNTMGRSNQKAAGWGYRVGRSRKHGPHLHGRKQCKFLSQEKVDPIPIVGHRFSSGSTDTK
jgi:hypothetical protein